jgi:hypothetical protein
MHTMLRHFAAASILLAAATAAHATTYEFSYHFLNGEVVSGKLDGTASGNLVEHISNATFSINGTAVAGLINSQNSTFSGNAVFSFNGLANNFLLFDRSFQNVLLSGSVNGVLATNVINYSTPGGAYAEGPGVEAYSASRWSLTSAVPEPVTYAMLLGGLALVGTVARRRRQAR